ncbi:hypothetical protein F4818DRAFT_445986 [Hypoxylon cercidicola]|nr:hypothetical protein F4818DRAFT_445986 [Hypoxylon cercidicola]
MKLHFASISAAFMCIMTTIASITIEPTAPPPPDPTAAAPPDPSLAFDPNIDTSDQPAPRSCSNLRLTDNYLLEAECLSPNGRIHSTLDLDHCFANYFGNLVFVQRDGGFTYSCMNELVGNYSTVLEARCSMGEGKGQKGNYFDLNDCNYIQNESGNLQCEGP